MSVERRADGAIVVSQPITPWRLLLVCLYWVPASAHLAAMAYLSVMELREATPSTIPSLLFCFGPVALFYLGFLYLAGNWWNTRTIIERDGHYLVIRSLVYGRWPGWPVRTDLRRFASLEASVLRYPRDAQDVSWRPSFRPRLQLAGRHIGRGGSWARFDGQRG